MNTKSAITFHVDDERNIETKDEGLRSTKEELIN